MLSVLLLFVKKCTTIFEGLVAYRQRKSECVCILPQNSPQWLNITCSDSAMRWAKLQEEYCTIWGITIRTHPRASCTHEAACVITAWFALKFNKPGSGKLRPHDDAEMYAPVLLKHTWKRARVVPRIWKECSCWTFGAVAFVGAVFWSEEFEGGWWGRSYRFHFDLDRMNGSVTMIRLHVHSFADDAYGFIILLKCENIGAWGDTNISDSNRIDAPYPINWIISVVFSVVMQFFTF